MFEHHMKAADLSNVLKIKSYEQRLILKELYHIQQELRKNQNWLESYDQDPVPYLQTVSEKIKSQLDKLSSDEKDAISRLDKESRAELQKVTGNSIY